MSKQQQRQLKYHNNNNSGIRTMTQQNIITLNGETITQQQLWVLCYAIARRSIALHSYNNSSMRFEYGYHTDHVAIGSKPLPISIAVFNMVNLHSMLNGNEIELTDCNLFQDIPYTLSGDYCGSTVETSNRKVISEQFENVDWIETRYDYHSAEWLSIEHFQLAIDIQTKKASSEDQHWERYLELIETIESLESYCVLDDNALFEAEQEQEQEEWESYQCSDFQSELRHTLSINETMENAIDDIDSDTIQKIYFALCENAGRYPEHSGQEVIWPELLNNSTQRQLALQLCIDASSTVADAFNTGCDCCNASMINNVLCHESGCPNDA